MNPYNFSVLFFAFATFIISLLIWMKRRDEIGKRYFIYSCTVSIWGIGYSIMTSQNVSYQVALFSIQIGCGAAVLIGVTFYHLALVFIHYEMKKTYRLLLKVFYATAFAILLTIFSPLFINYLAPIPEFRHYPRPGITYMIFTGLFFVTILFSFAVLFKKMRTQQEPARSQMIGFILAHGAGYIGGGLSFLPVYEIMVPQYGLFLLPLYPVILAYFMIQKRLLDVDELIDAIQREKLTAIGLLAAGINHEIKTPLYVIRELAASHLVKIKEGFYPSKEDLIKRSNEILEKTSTQAQRAMDIMKRFAAYTQRRNDPALVTEKLHLKNLLDDIMPLLQHEIVHSNIELIRDIPDEANEIVGDRRHLEEVFLNLILNASQAIKKTEKEIGNRKILLSARAEGAKIKVTVEDTGPGIAADHLPHIFEPFYTTKADGSGLGLYVTKQLVEENKGSISVASSVGKGTVITLEFRR